MRKYIILLCCCFCSFASLSQDVTVKWGEIENEKLYFRKILSHGTDIIKLNLRKEGKGKKAEWIPILKKYDGNSLKLILTVSIPGNAGKKYETLIKLKSNLFAIISEEGSDKDEIIYSAQKINPITLQPDGSPIKIATFLYPEEDHMVFEKALMVMSSDSSKVLFRGADERKPKVCIGGPCPQPPSRSVVLFDENMTQLWSGHVEAPSDKGFRKSLNVTNDGKIVALFIRELDKKSEVEQMFSFYGPLFNKRTDVKIDFKDPMLEEVMITNESNTDLSFVGKFRKPGGRTTGIYTGAINLRSMAFSFQPFLFEKSFAEMLDTEERLPKDVSIDPFYNSIQVVISPEKKLTYLLEYRRFPIPKHPDMSLSSYWRWHNIISFQLTPDGKAIFTRVPKKLTAWQSDILSVGFVAVQYQNKTLLFYRDWKKNLDKNLQEPSYTDNKFEKQSLVMAILSENGKLERTIIQEQVGKEISPAMLKSFALSPGKVILISRDWNNPDEPAKEQVGMIEIK